MMMGLLFMYVLSGAAQTPADTITAAPQDTVGTQVLGDVTVTAQRQLIRQDIDRIGYDVQADDDAKTKTVMDMLRKVPLVTIDGQENILVKGNSNYKIYKNGHLDPSLTKNAKEILKAMPATVVKRIEVVTDPGAREDAEGVNAILNIVMMEHKRKDGLTGSLTAGYTSLKHTNLGAYLAAQFGKLIVSVDYGYGGMTKKETQNRGTVQRLFTQTGHSQRADVDNTNPGAVHYADINASYEIDSLNLLSASFGGYYYLLDVGGGAHVQCFDGQGLPLYQYRESYRMPDYGHHSWNGRLDYEHKTRRAGEKLTLSYMLALTRQHTEQETLFTERQDVPFDYTGYLHNSRERFTEHTFQADYLRPLAEGHQVEAGMKYIHRRNGSNTTQRYYQPTETTPLSTDFNHTTQVAALYADYLFSRGNWSARAGLRYEYSRMDGAYPRHSSDNFHRHLNDWVPQASVKYQFDDRQSLKLSYTTSITRPGITYLNPAVVATPLRVDYGNARLVSARQQSIALWYMYVGQRLTLQCVPQYSFSDNALGSIIFADGDVRHGTWGNVIRQYRWQMEAYAQWKPFDGMSVVANINLTDHHARNTSADLRQHLTSAFYYVNLSQQLPWRLQVTAFAYGQCGHSPETIYSYERSWARYGFTLQRAFLSDDRLTVRLTAMAPFHRDMHFYTRTTQGDILGWGDSVNAQNGRQFQLTASFRFGKLKSMVKKTETTIDNTDEVGGITRGNK